MPGAERGARKGILHRRQQPLRLSRRQPRQIPAPKQNPRQVRHPLRRRPVISPLRPHRAPQRHQVAPDRPHRVVHELPVPGLAPAQPHSRRRHPLLKTETPVLPHVVRLPVTEAVFKLFSIRNRWILKRFYYLCCIFKGLGGDCLRI